MAENPSQRLAEINDWLIKIKQIIIFLGSKYHITNKTAIIAVACETIPLSQKAFESISVVLNADLSSFGTQFNICDPRNLKLNLNFNLLRLMLKAVSQRCEVPFLSKTN